MRLPSFEKLKNLLTPIYGESHAAHYAEGLLTKANMYLREQKQQTGTATVLTQHLQQQTGTTTMLTQHLLDQPLTAQAESEQKTNAKIYQNLCELNLAASLCGTVLHSMAKMGNFFFDAFKGMLKGTGIALFPSGVVACIVPIVMIIKYNYYTSASEICKALQYDISLDYPYCDSNQTALVADTCIEQHWAYDRQLHLAAVNATSPVDCLNTSQLYAEGDKQNKIIHDYRYKKLPQNTWITLVAGISFGALGGAYVETSKAPKQETPKEAIRYILSSSLRLIATELKNSEAGRELTRRFPLSIQQIILSYFFTNNEVTPDSDHIVEIKDYKDDEYEDYGSSCCPDSP